MTSRPAAMEVLRQEHANMTLLLDLFERQVAALREHKETDFVLIGGIVDYFLTYPDLMHHPKEDILFHRLQELDPAAAAEAGNLVFGHEALGVLARGLARAMVDHLLQDTDESRLWLCSLGQDFIDKNRHHMAGEEQDFFPAALRTLSEEDWDYVGSKIRTGEDPLFGAVVESRFQSLHQFLADREELTALEC